MKRLILVATALLLAIAATGGSSSAAPTVTVTHRAMFQGIQPPARYFTLAEFISEFAPGQAARPNYGGSTRYFSVIEGEVTVTIGDETAVYAKGETWSVGSGVYFNIRNDGTARARVFLTALQMPGVTGARPVPGSTPPANPSRLLWSASTSVYVPAGKIDLMQLIQESEPGFKTAAHVMNHPHVYIVMSGENTLNYLDGGVETFATGQQGVMEPGRPGTMANSGDVNSSLAFSWLITPGTPPTSPVTGSAASTAGAVTPPNTGDGGLRDAGDPMPIAILGGAGILTLLLAVASAGRGLRRR